MLCHSSCEGGRVARGSLGWHRGIETLPHMKHTDGAETSGSGHQASTGTTRHPDNENATIREGALSVVCSPLTALTVE